eukprot:Blabericola_migrator_1__2773@NODE_1792_length_3786_cov_44_642915_g1156_i0_p2_GENE_NODE_1792_length_3786_cov_44_642915_g1156_i0NODE_1792_length_3786_cov_44_642915_g1156_i0_p2_ORF_typecomplete_len144_score20_85DNA_primase_S/PF01896_19/0_0071nsp7/PF08716_10/1_3e02nsp7/PF08716_10/0_9_NODE_1792_length_3786_cov_44_642915_g1156_i08751306
MWPRILEEQNFFFHPSKGSSCLDQLKELLQGIFSSKAFDVEGIFKEIRNAHGIWGDSLKLWHKLSSILNDAKPSKPGDTHANDALDAIMVYFLQPKLDINVSKVRQKMRRSSVHKPLTGYGASSQVSICHPSGNRQDLLSPPT